MSKPTKVQKLRQLADALTPKIEEKRNSAIGQQNHTRRRASIAASMWQDADRLERVQYALYGLAEGHETDTLHPLLEKVTTKTVIESLLYHDGWPSDWCGDDLKRFAKIGLTPENYQEARAAFMVLVKPPDRSEERRRRDMERRARELVGQLPGYFPTPPTVISLMIDHADKWHHGLRVLEPSAGAGHIADALEEEAGADWTIHVVELAPSLRELLRAKGHELVGDDFLEFNPTMGYDRIVMNPPFEGFQDIDHVRHAYECLRPGGRLVSVMSESTFFRNGKAAEFREWLEDLGGWDVDLPAGAFESSGTGVKARLVVVDKPQARPTLREAGTLGQLALPLGVGA